MKRLPLFLNSNRVQFRNSSQKVFIRCATKTKKYVDLEINNKHVRVEEGMTILQACATIGINIPRFCYHEALSIAGNCRMCLVEVAKQTKPIASCAMPVTPLMKVYTNTMMVKKQEKVLWNFY